MAAHFSIRWKRPRKIASELELDQYPATSEGYYSGFYPAPLTHFEPTKNATKRRLKDVEEINVYLSDAVEYFPAYLEQPKFKINFRRNHLKSEELNNYPQTPAAYYDGYYPGSILAEGFKVRFDQSIQAIPELNSYPAAVIAATLPAFIEQPFFRSKFDRKLLSVLELDQYPETVISLNDIAGAGTSLISDSGVYGKSLIYSLGFYGLSGIEINLAGSSFIVDRGVYGASPIGSDGIDGESEMKDGV